MSVRCFISVDVDDPIILDELVSFQSALKGTGADVKCVEMENIHLTLRFLGDVRQGLLGQLSNLVEEVEFDPFRMELRGIGAFPNLRRPRVVWVGLTEGADELSRIFNDLEADLTELGFRPESRGFSPHITLARVRSGRNRAQLVEQLMMHADDGFGGSLVESIRLKKSVLTPRGPIYSIIAESPSPGST